MSTDCWLGFGFFPPTFTPPDYIQIAKASTYHWLLKIIPQTQTSVHFSLFAKLKTATCNCLKYTLHPKETAFKCTVKLSPNCRSCCTVYISPWCHGELDIISIYTFLNTLPFNFTWSLVGKYCKPSHRFHKWRQTLEPVTGSQSTHISRTQLY